MTTAHTKTCTGCQKPVKRYNAVIRGDGHQQNHWHPACFTVGRAVNGIPAAEVIEAVASMSLGERLTQLRGSSSGYSR